MNYLILKGIDGLREYAFTLGKEHNIEIQYSDKHRLYRAIEILHHGDVDSLRNQTKKMVYPIKDLLSVS